MIAFVLCVLVGVIVLLLADRFYSEAAHRRERERLVRAVLARHMPELQALQRVFEPEGREPRKLRAVGEDRDPNIPLTPEGM